MKTILLGMALVGLSGCAHTYITDWNASDRTVTACGNRWADAGDLKKAAENSCGTEATPLHGFQQASGAFAQQSLGGVSVEQTYRGCIQFQCGYDHSDSDSIRNPASATAGACLFSATPSNNFGASEFFSKHSK